MISYEATRCRKRPILSLASTTESISILDIDKVIVAPRRVVNSSVPLSPPSVLSKNRDAHGPDLKATFVFACPLSPALAPVAFCLNPTIIFGLPVV